jgi:hypothetical protein
MLGDVLFLYGGVLWLVLPVLLYVAWRHRTKLWNEAKSKPLPLLLFAFTILPPLLISIIKPVFNSRLAIVGLHLFVLTMTPLFRQLTGKYVLPLVWILLTGAFMVAVHPATEACDNRSLATYLIQNTRDNDVVIYTSLTRMPIDYYLTQTRSRKLFEISFPSEIDRHPGYVGRISEPSRRAEFEAEARDLVTRIRAMQKENPGLRVFYLHGANPEIDELLGNLLKEEFELLPDQEVECTSGSLYLKTISVYR